jgi:hypothetical protein
MVIAQTIKMPKPARALKRSSLAVLERCVLPVDDEDSIVVDIVNSPLEQPLNGVIATTRETSRALRKRSLASVKFKPAAASGDSGLSPLRLVRAL